MASSSSTSGDDEGTATTPDWLSLPRDVTAKILEKVGAFDMVRSAERVCSVWRNICMDPLMWRTVDMRGRNPYNFEVRRAVDRSCGHLEEIHLQYFIPESFLCSIADRARNLRCLGLGGCWPIFSENTLIKLAKKLPLLEELDISYLNLSSRSLEAIGTWCPHLRSLKLNKVVYRLKDGRGNDNEAFAIAKIMPKLQHLQLIANRLTEAGLHAILDGCPLLESLDLQYCFNVNLHGSLGKRCAEQIKELGYIPCHRECDGHSEKRRRSIDAVLPECS